jgi:hypothetical protein
MMLGRLAAALLAVLLIEGIRRLGRVEPGAAMGTVFTAMSRAASSCSRPPAPPASISTWSTR